MDVGQVRLLSDHIAGISKEGMEAGEQILNGRTTPWNGGQWNG